jgi:hypothetical protein
MHCFLYSGNNSTYDRKKCKCITCIGALKSRHNLEEIKTIGTDTNENIARLVLIVRKSRGGLQIPSEGVIEICNATERYIRFLLRANNDSICHIRDIDIMICNSVLKQLGPKCDRLFSGTKVLKIICITWRLVVIIY